MRQQRIDCCEDGETEISVWGDLDSPEDVEQLIAWLKLAKNLMVGWKRIHEKARHGEASHRAVVAGNIRPDPKRNTQLRSAQK
jgi:hypothetical protein